MLWVRWIEPIEVSTVVATFMTPVNFKRIAVLTSPDSWFIPYARRLVNILKHRGYRSALFFNSQEIRQDVEVVFMLSYYKIAKESFLKSHQHNLVVHASDLPKGRGWSPLFWQVLEGKNKIPIVLFEADVEMDQGDIYIKDWIRLEGTELHDEIRKKEAHKIIEMCLRFLDRYRVLRPIRQKGRPAYYRKRIPKDSRLDINKTIKQKFSQLRIVDNNNFPAFFYYKGHKYIIKIFESGRHMV